ncbi:hypothetical protein ACLMJK_008612 [Lecanora helva]
MRLDPVFHQFLVKKPVSVPSILQGSGRSGLDSDTEILCEILDLDVNAVASLDPYKRAKVLEEAKRNIKKWPILNSVQRVEVNCALVELQSPASFMRNDTPLNHPSSDDWTERKVVRKSELDSDGKFCPVFAISQDGTVDISYQWMYTDDENPLTMVSAIDHRTSQSRAQASQRIIGNSAIENYKAGQNEKAQYTDLDNELTLIDDDSTHSHDLESLNLEVAKVMTGKVYHPEDIKRPSIKEPEVVASSAYLLPVERVEEGMMFFPAPTWNDYELRECKVVVDGLDINALIAKATKGEDIKEGRDGFMVADWRMIMHFDGDEQDACPFAESIIADQREVVAQTQRQLSSYEGSRKQGTEPKAGAEELCSEWI